eukprot:6207451-Pleurochrysis_carterae.AAC.5
MALRSLVGLPDSDNADQQGRPQLPLTGTSTLCVAACCGLATSLCAPRWRRRVALAAALIGGGAALIAMLRLCGEEDGCEPYEPFERDETAAVQAATGRGGCRGEGSVSASGAAADNDADA